MVGLPADRLLPGEPEPGEVADNGRLKFRTAPRGVDVLDPQQEAPVHATGEIRIQQRRRGMPEMKPAVRTRGEAENGLRHGSSSAKAGTGQRPVTILDSEKALKQGLDALARLEPALRRLVPPGITPVLRKRAPGFEGRAWILVG